MEECEKLKNLWWKNEQKLRKLTKDIFHPVKICCLHAQLFVSIMGPGLYGPRVFPFLYFKHDNLWSPYLHSRDRYTYAPTEFLVGNWNLNNFYLIFLKMISIFRGVQPQSEFTFPFQYFKYSNFWSTRYSWERWTCVHTWIFCRKFNSEFFFFI